MMSFNTKQKQVTIIILAVIGAFILGFGTSTSLSGGRLGAQLTALQLGKGQPANVNFDLLWQAWNQVHSDYVGTIDDQKLVYGAVRGMVAGLDDPYTVFFDPEEAKRFAEDVGGKFFGVGIEIGVQNKSITVISPLEDSPAAKAGIKAGDIIVKIDDKDTGEMTLPDAVSRIRGDKGSTVKLTILPKDAAELKEIAIVRDLIQVQSVKYEVKSGNIGYVRLTQFSEDTPTLTSQALQDLKSKNVAGVVLDLRNNPGGFLTGAQDIASMFLKEGKVVSEKEKTGDTKDLPVTGAVIMPETPLVVLVNEGSASASEIVAGAIQDYGRGKLVGVKTFGKGSVQNIKNLLGNSTLKITIAEWLTPKGRHINKQGVEPDVEVKLTADDQKNNRDPQLDKALELLKK